MFPIESKKIVKYDRFGRTSCLTGLFISYLVMGKNIKLFSRIFRILGKWQKMA